jgi:hypothetical protein
LLQSLRFLAYFCEDVPGSSLEPTRVRVVQIWWYPSTSELRLFEPKSENAGIDQGDYLKRCRPLVVGDEPRPVELSDMARAGAILSLVAPRIDLTVIDADSFTRKWMETHELSPFGTALAPPEVPHPDKPVAGHRMTRVALDAGLESNAALGFYSRAPDRRARFEQAEGRVLRFEGLLDERQRGNPSYGDLVVVAVHYFLEDETMEVIAPEGINSGRGRTGSKLLNRQRVPRDDRDNETESVASGREGPSDMPEPPMEMASAVVQRPGTASGPRPSAAHMPPSRHSSSAPQESSRMRLGLVTPAEAAADARKTHASLRGGARYRFSPGSWSGTYVSPITGQPLYGGGSVTKALQDGATAAPVTHITPDLLRAGSWVTVFGRRIWLRRADGFTAAWYAENFGVDQLATSASGPVIAPAPRRPTEAVIPPHVGLAAVGDEEETRMNANKLMPTWRPKIDFAQFFESDGKILRFHATIDDPRPQDATREFVISFYLVDSTLAINEALPPNAGRWGGRFLERGKYRNARAPRALGPKDSDDNVYMDHSLASTMLARERSLGDVGALYGYGHGYGQGYVGGVLGRQDRTGAGCTGVPPTRGIGIRESLPVEPLARFFEATDFFEGAKIEFTHSPGQVFNLERGDGFTRRWLKRHGLPVSEEEPSAPEGSESPLGKIVSILAGCLASVRRAFLARDRRDTGAVPISTATRILAAYGVSPPDCDASTIAAALGMFVKDSGQAELSIAWPEFCDSLLSTLRTMAMKGLTATEGTPEEGLRIEQQLRSAVLSSRAHLRKCFRELGRSVPGVITPAEFRHLLRRHHLDLGMTMEDVVAAMARYPKPELEEVLFESRLQGVEVEDTRDLAIPPGSISWSGFLWALAGGRTGAASVSEEEVLEIENIARGVSVGLDLGAGHAPEFFPHPPRSSAWGKSRVAWSDGRGSGWTPTEVALEVAEKIRGGVKMTERKAVEPEQSAPIVVEDLEAPQEEDATETQSRESVLRALGKFFRHRKWELRRVMMLYDPSGSGMLPRSSIASALCSCGYELSSDEQALLFGEARVMTKRDSWVSLLDEMECV